MSQSLARKFLEYAKQFVDFENEKERHEFIYYHNLYSCMSGNWDLIKDYDEELMVNNLKIGEFWHVTTHYVCIANVKNEQGRFNEAEEILNKLYEIYESYEYDCAKVWHDYGLCYLKIYSRNLFDAIKVCDEAIPFSEKIGMDPLLIHFWSQKADAQIFLKDLDGAVSSLKKAEEIFNQQQIVPPTYASSYLIAYFKLYLYLLEEATTSNDNLKIKEYSKKSNEFRKKMLKNSKSFGYSRLEYFRVLSLYHWIINKQNKAIKWWEKSIKEAKRMKGRPTLARIYKDMGSRIIEEKSNYNEVNGITAEQYLERAREMFIEMDLQWDLDQLDRVVSYR
jgi:tetratricopeptide (TPR) repeat protein